jgi:hypothetical protein
MSESPIVKVRKQALPYRATSKKILVSCRNVERITSGILVDRLGIDRQKANNNLSRLVQYGRLERTGRGTYRLTDRGRQEAMGLSGASIGVNPMPNGSTTNLVWKDSGDKEPVKNLHEVEKAEDTYWRDKFVELAFLLAGKKGEL